MKNAEIELIRVAGDVIMTSGGGGDPTYFSFNRLVYWNNPNDDYAGLLFAYDYKDEYTKPERISTNTLNGYSLTDVNNAIVAYRATSISSTAGGGFVYGDMKFSQVPLISYTSDELPKAIELTNAEKAAGDGKSDYVGTYEFTYDSETEAYVCTRLN